MKEKIRKIHSELNDGRITVSQATEQVLDLLAVSDCQFESYAAFCIECDRQGLKPIKYRDYLEIG